MISQIFEVSASVHSSVADRILEFIHTTLVLELSNRLELEHTLGQDSGHFTLGMRAFLDLVSDGQSRLYHNLSSGSPFHNPYPDFGSEDQILSPITTFAGFRIEKSRTIPENSIFFVLLDTAYPRVTYFAGCLEKKPKRMLRCLGE